MDSIGCGTTSSRVDTSRDGLSGNQAYPILQDHAGAIWIGTEDGKLNKFVNQRVITYDLADGLPSTRVTCIFEDRSDRLWVGTEGGLSYLQGERFIRDTAHASLAGTVVRLEHARAGAGMSAHG